MLRAVLAGAALVATSLFCGFWAELVPVYLDGEPTPIVGGYFLGKPYGGKLEVLGPPYVDDEGKHYHVVVRAEVVRIGWDERFILAEQHYYDPFDDGKEGKSHFTYHIIDLESGTVHSYLTEERFSELRNALSVANDIEMRDAQEVHTGE